MSNDTIMKAQLMAVTSLTLALTGFLVSVEGYVISLAEHLLILTSDKTGVNALIAKIDQTQASLSALRANAENVERELRALGLV